MQLKRLSLSQSHRADENGYAVPVDELTEASALKSPYYPIVLPTMFYIAAIEMDETEANDKHVVSVRISESDGHTIMRSSPLPLNVDQDSNTSHLLGEFRNIKLHHKGTYTIALEVDGLDLGSIAIRFA